MTDIFQGKHTTGHLWWKQTYYKYFKYFEGSMVAVSIYPMETIQALEKGK